MKKVRSPAVLPKKKSEPFAVFQYSNFTSKQASYTESAAEKGKKDLAYWSGRREMLKMQNMTRQKKTPPE